MATIRERAPGGVLSCLVRWLYGVWVGGIVVLWHERLPWIALGAFMAMCVLVRVRGAVVRRQHETWMDDLARATFRLLSSPSVRVTTRWPGSAGATAAKPLPLYLSEPAADPVVHVRRPQQSIRDAFRPDKTPGPDA
jgi:hypothetical protein